QYRHFIRSLTITSILTSGSENKLQKDITRQHTMFPNFFLFPSFLLPGDVVIARRTSIPFVRAGTVRRPCRLGSIGLGPGEETCENGSVEVSDCFGLLWINIMSLHEVRERLMTDWCVGCCGSELL